MNVKPKQKHSKEPQPIAATSSQPCTKPNVSSTPNRTIKFRAWDDGTMLSMTVDTMYGLTRFFGFLREDAILMQFTGLKDKNGLEIYEGDILREPAKDDWDNTNYSCFEVFFHDGDANSDYNIGYTMNRMHNHGCICGGYIPSFKPNKVSKMEVIGNIFQTPELLK